MVGDSNADETARPANSPAGRPGLSSAADEADSDPYDSLAANLILADIVDMHRCYDHHIYGRFATDMDMQKAKDTFVAVAKGTANEYKKRVSAKTNK